MEYKYVRTLTIYPNGRFEVGEMREEPDFEMTRMIEEAEAFAEKWMEEGTCYTVLGAPAMAPLRERICSHFYPQLYTSLGTAIRCYWGCDIY